MEPLGQMKYAIVVGTLLCIMTIAQTFKVTQLEVPTYLDPREWAELVCRYDLGDNTLMLLRLFRDDEELFRYMPTQDTDLGPERVYNTSWLSIERAHCVPGACSLRILAEPRPLINNATFRCEISSDFTPDHKEDQKEDIVGYASPPRENPTITGLPEFVEVGDKLQLNCSTDYSWPTPVVTWYINDHLVRTNASKAGSVNETFGLETQWNILEFTVTKEDLLGGTSVGAEEEERARVRVGGGDADGMSGVVSVRCQSSIEEFGKSRSTEHNLQTRSHGLSSSLSSKGVIGFTTIRLSLLLMLPLVICQANLS